MRIMILFSLILAATSCISYDKCVDKYGHLADDSIYTAYDTVIQEHVPVAADSSQVILQADTMQPGIIYENDTDSSGINIQYWKDQYTNLFNIKAKQPEKIVSGIIEIHDKVPCPPQVVLESKGPWYKEYWKKYCRYAGIFLPLIILLILIFRRK